MIVAARSTSARRDRNVILVLDYSGSVQPVLGDSFSDTSDQVGLVIFSTAGRRLHRPHLRIGIEATRLWGEACPGDGPWAGELGKLSLPDGRVSVALSNGG
jgi:hypothetical protein